MQPISKSDFSNKYWKKVTSFNFVANQAMCGVTLHELPKVHLEMPIGFIKIEDRFALVAVLGLHNNSNLFVDGNGRWTLNYIPAFYRTYPFALANTDDDRLVLCIDEDSGLLSDDSNDQPFFDAEGELDDFLKSVVGLLNALNADQKSTVEACAMLEKHELIQPWEIEIKYDNGEHRVEGLYKIDEAKFNELSDEAFIELRHSGALQLIYCQSLSAPHILTLVGLARSAQSPKESEAAKQLDLGSLSDSGNINLDNL